MKTQASRVKHSQVRPRHDHPHLKADVEPRDNEDNQQPDGDDGGGPREVRGGGGEEQQQPDRAAADDDGREKQVLDPSLLGSHLSADGGHLQPRDHAEDQDEQARLCMQAGERGRRASNASANAWCVGMDVR